MTDSEDKSEESENTTLTELKTLMSDTLTEFKSDFLGHIDESIAQVYRDFDVEDQSEHEHDDGSPEVEARIDSFVQATKKTSEPAEASAGSSEFKLFAEQFSTSEKTSPAIDKDLCNIVMDLFKDKLPKEKLENIQEKYLRPENCANLVAPKFLEGPALKAVQRYEALPGGLASALKTLQDRFGRSSQVVRACVDALTKGPMIQNSDKQALRQLADDAQVTYDTLENMGYLGEMNTDNLERIISRLPRGRPSEPIAIKSRLGWWSVLGGSRNADSMNQPSNSNCCVVGEDVQLSRQLQEFWKMESYGTGDDQAKPMSVEDRQALKTIDSTITKRDDHYQMGLLWKDDNPSLLYNRAVAEARLQHLNKRFRHDPDLEKKYRAVMTDYLAKGYARRLTDEEAST
ncbi:hypothetical protein QZH41_007050 [Actinostola sp. cb2023]|nr:hypothetical protein QZH41_007050 [Actinostola sp. cb2023]